MFGLYGWKWHTYYDHKPTGRLLVTVEILLPSASLTVILQCSEWHSDSAGIVGHQLAVHIEKGLAEPTAHWVAGEEGDPSNVRLAASPLRFRSYHFHGRIFCLHI